MRLNRNNCKSAIRIGSISCEIMTIVEWKPNIAPIKFHNNVFIRKLMEINEKCHYCNVLISNKIYTEWIGEFNSILNNNRRECAQTQRYAHRSISYDTKLNQIMCNKYSTMRCNVFWKQAWIKNETHTHTHWHKHNKYIQPK